jgi:hypothetical protein
MILNVMDNVYYVSDSGFIMVLRYDRRFSDKYMKQFYEISQSGKKFYRKI